MDPRRFDTGQVLATGVLNIDAPKTDIPLERKRFCGTDCDYGQPSKPALTTAVEAGLLLDAPEYYGCVYGWKQDDGIYRGLLLQYRSVADSQTFQTATELVEWFSKTVSAVAG